MRSEKDAKAIADALQPGGVINNYIRSKQTSQEQGNKMLDEMYERIFNFNPEATRADGSKVGPEGFGESIFANTRFAKMVANKKLAEKSERQKQEKSIDSGTLQIADKSTASTEKQTAKAQTPRATNQFTPSFYEGLKIETKGKSTTEINEEVNKQFDKAIESDLEALGPITSFGQTKNIGPAVAALMEKATGMPAKVFTDKSKNIAKKDATSGALTNVKQYLNKNAQRDFQNLPDAFAKDSGKATFIPENVKKALYKKNDKGQFVLDKSKTLKDYKKLLGDMQKPVYRAAEAQTIKGLVALSLRNMIFEKAVPSPQARSAKGVKFSKTITTEQNEVLSKIGAARNKQQARKAAGIKNTVINNGNRVKMQKELQDAIDTGKISTETFDAAKLGNSGAKRSRLANGDVVYDLSNGQTIPGVLKESPTGERLFDPPTAKQVEAFAGTGVTLVAENNRLYYGVKDPAYIKARAATKPMSDLKAIRVNVKNAFTETGQDQAKQNQDILYNVSKELEAAVKSKDISPEMMATIIEGAYQATTGLIKISYPFVGKSVKGEYALTWFL